MTSKGKQIATVAGVFVGTALSVGIANHQLNKLPPVEREAQIKYLANGSGIKEHIKAAIDTADIARRELGQGMYKKAESDLQTSNLLLNNGQETLCPSSETKLVKRVLQNLMHTIERTIN